MNCHQCLKMPESRRRCDAYPIGWPYCNWRITSAGMPKNADTYNPHTERQRIQDEYKASLRRLGYKI